MSADFASPVVEPIQEQTVIRHLRTGGSPAGICGNTDGPFIHPSKARKTDCTDCRAQWRESRTKDAPSTWTLGDLMRFIDGSIWRVESVRYAGLGLRCALGSSVISGGKHRIGELTTVTREPGMDRVTLDDLNTEAALRQGKKIEKKAAERKAANKPEPWRPTAAEVIRVYQLRATVNPATLGGGPKFRASRPEGRCFTLEEIDEEMGWSPTHGNRILRILTKRLLALGEKPVPKPVQVPDNDELP